LDFQRARHPPRWCLSCFFPLRVDSFLLTAGFPFPRARCRAFLFLRFKLLLLFFCPPTQGTFPSPPFFPDIAFAVAPLFKCPGASSEQPWLGAVGASCDGFLVQKPPLEVVLLPCVAVRQIESLSLFILRLLRFASISISLPQPHRAAHRRNFLTHFNSLLFSALLVVPSGTNFPFCLASLRSPALPQNVARSHNPPLLLPWDPCCGRCRPSGSRNLLPFFQRAP